MSLLSVLCFLASPSHSAPDGIEIREGPIDVVGWKKDLGFGPPDDDLVAGFSRCVVQLQLDSGLADGQLVLEGVRRVHLLSGAGLAIKPEAKD